MTLKPILFTPAMVAAILDGRKTVTRRVLKRQPDEDGLAKVIDGPWTDASGRVYKCPYGQRGTILWVKETHWRLGTWKHEDGHWRFDAQDSEMNPPLFKEPHESVRPEYKTYFGYHKRPSIFMPRKFARLLLRVKDVRVEQLQDITPQDCVAEGIPGPASEDGYLITGGMIKGEFLNLWNSINGKKPGCSFADNSWVWRVEFERIEKEVA